MRVDAQPTRARVQHWLDLGCSMQEIAVGAGLPQSTVESFWFSGSSNVHHWTAERIAAADVRSERIAATRKLQALAVMGWSCSALTRFGSTREAIRRARMRPPRFLSPGLKRCVDAA